MLERGSPDAQVLLHLLQEGRRPLDPQLVGLVGDIPLGPVLLRAERATVAWRVTRVLRWGGRWWADSA